VGINVVVGGDATAGIDDAISDGETTRAPSQNAVFDALALKVPTSTANSGTSVDGVSITLGAITAGTSTNDGGSFSFVAGNTASTNPNSGGGSVQIVGGNQTASQTGNAGEGRGGGDVVLQAGTAKNQFGGNVSLTAGSAEWQGGDAVLAAGGGLIDDDGYGGSALIYGGSVTGGTAQAGHIDLIPGVNPDSDALNGKTRCNGVLKMHGLADDPTAGENGDMYYNTTSNKFRGYANGSWVDLH
jgi:hypothetical protein